VKHSQTRFQPTFLLQAIASVIRRCQSDRPGRQKKSLGGSPTRGIKSFADLDIARIDPSH
jgi:hypothetical protein